MKVKEVKVEPYMLLGYCDKCGGEMRPTGVVFTTYPAIYQYKCSECGHIDESNENLNVVYYKHVEKKKK